MLGAAGDSRPEDKYHVILFSTEAYFMVFKIVPIY